MVDKSNPHADISTEESKAAELAAAAEAAKEAEAVAAKEAAEAAVKKAEETAGDLPKEEPSTEGEEEEADQSEEGEQEETDDDTPLDTEAFGDTGSEVGNSVLQLLQNAGATPEEARSLLYDAVAKNDMSLIDQAALEDKVGKAKAAIILAGAKTVAADIAEQNKAIFKEVYSVVGDAAGWKKVRTWAEKNIPEAEQAEYNALIQRGGPAAKFAASELVSAYNGDSKNTEITDTPRYNADVDTSSSSEVLTAKEYYNRMAEATRKGLDTTAIKAARARGRKKGI